VIGVDISPKMLELWGTALRNAGDSDQMVPLLLQIREDVRSLLQGGLETTAVTADRYPAMTLTKGTSR
jgi:hypothetical protein